MSVRDADGGYFKVTRAESSTHGTTMHAGHEHQQGCVRRVDAFHAIRVWDCYLRSVCLVVVEWGESCMGLSERGGVPQAVLPPQNGNKRL